MAKFLRSAAQLHKNPSLVFIERLVTRFAQELPENARVLDAGAGDCRYKPIFTAHRYEAADFGQVTGKRYGDIDIICDLRSIPVEDDRYDAAICTQVLAHLPDPLAALKELRRVLRPGGRLLLTCPLFFQENERPYDFYRYTRYGLEHLFTQAGFEVQSLEEIEGYFGALQYQLGMAAMRLPMSPKEYGGGIAGLLSAAAAPFWKALFAAGCQFFTWHELRHRSRPQGICINYAIIGRKPTHN